MITSEEYQQRREAFLTTLPPRSIAIIANGREKIRKGDCNYPFSPNSNFYYLTGFTEAEAVAVFIPESPDGEYILFNQEDDPLKTIWTGKRIGQQGAVEKFGAHKSYPISMLEKFLKEFARDYNDHSLFVCKSDNELTNKLKQWKIDLPEHEVADLIGELRLIKSPAEIQLMKKAAEISSKAHLRVMQTCRPGMHEYQLEAEFIHECAHQGARFQAYPAIVATGANACVLHYENNEAQLQDGDLLLIDAGCEYQHYASDITRTYPVSGKFTEAQKMIYQLVLDTQLAIINMIKPGIAFNELQMNTSKLLAQGLISLGILKDDLEKVIKEKQYRQYYMHGVSHWLGLDVHDVGEYQVNGKYRPLAAGNVLTVEPGIYIAEDDTSVEPQWRGIAVRIEDDVVVTQTGCELLSDVPKDIAAIESLKC